MVNEVVNYLLFTALYVQVQSAETRLLFEIAAVAITGRHVISISVLFTLSIVTTCYVVLRKLIDQQFLVVSVRSSGRVL